MLDLLIPETGTVIWMLLAAGIVFFVLIKWGFPMLTGMVDRRNDFIEKSLKSAKEANERLAGIQEECDRLLKETRAEQARIIKDASERRDRIVSDAEAQAREEAGKIVADAREQIRQERDDALRGLRRQVAEMSVQIAEKVLVKELSDEDSQMDMIDRLVDEVNK